MRGFSDPGKASSAAAEPRDVKDGGPGAPSAAGEHAFDIATRAGGIGVQRQATSTTGGPLGFIVEDDVEPAAGQMRRTDFVARAVPAIEAAATSELARFGKTAKDCPYLEFYVRYYRDKPAAHIERMIAKYARPEATDASSLLDAMLDRVRQAVSTWAATGKVDVPRAGAETGGPELPALGFDGPLGAADPRALRASLGTGRPLDAATRSRMERGFGRDFGDVRVHNDGAAGRAATSASARAFTIGTDIAFGAGQYRPGTTRGDLMLAHELAHVEQQEGGEETPRAFSSSNDGALEVNADEAAISAVARSGLAADGLAEHLEPHVPARGAGLRLQRCGSAEEEKLPKAPESFTGTVEDVPEETGAVPSAVSPAAAGGTAESIFLNAKSWKEAADADLLMIRGRSAGAKKDQVFVLPARGLVQMAELPSEPARAPGTTASGASTSRGPGFMLPAVGHAQVILVRTARGTGMLVDVGGTPTGSTVPVVQATSLALLQVRNKIDRIDAAVYTHAHSDHSKGLGLLASQGNFTGSDVFVHPGWERATVGPLADAYRDLTAADATRFPAGWQPQTLTSSTVTGPTGQSVTRGSLPVGEATLEFAIETRALADFNAALRAGNWSRASSLADRASGLKLITSQGRSMLDVGDMRGRNIETLYNAMGEQAFRQLFGRAEIVSGLHHLGAVSTPADVRGLQLLLKTLGAGSRPITVVAQVGAPFPVNDALVKALTESGVRVVYVQEATGALSGITARAGGAVTVTGGKEFGIEKSVGEAQDRVGRIRGAIRALEALPSYGEGTGLTRQQIIDQLKAEALRLENLLASRQELATKDLARAGGRQPATQTQLETNLKDIEVQQGMEQRVGKEELQRLARLGPETIDAYTRELKAAQARGRASARLFALVSQVEPETAKRILLDELGKPMSRNQQRSAWRRALTRLRAQARAQQALTARGGAPVSGGAKGFAILGLALQAWELAEPFVAMAVEESRTQERKDFYLAFHDLVWWNEKGLAPMFVGADDSGNPVEGAALRGGVEKRLYEDLPKDQRSSVSLSTEAQSATALKQLYVPEMNQWPAERRDLFWRSLLLWTTAHINSYDDYATEILEIPGGAPIREDPAQKDTAFGERAWQIRVGVPSEGHVQERWQDSADLTRIMNATVKRMIKGTEAQIEERWAKRLEAVPTGPSFVAPGTSVRGPIDQPTARAHANSGRIKVYEQYHGRVSQLSSFHFWDNRPEFLVYANMVTPKGYAWVTGGNYNTAAAMRAATVWHWVGAVKIPREPRTLDPNNPDFMRSKKPEEYMNAEELAAHTAANNQTPGVFRQLYSKDESSVYHSEVTIYQQGPNVSGLLLVELEDIERDD